MATRNRRKRLWGTMATGVLLLIALAACSPAAEPALPSQPTSGPTATSAPMDVDEQAPSSTPASSETDTPASTPTSEAEMENAGPTPTLRVGLQATDPSMVDLAAGGPTLVEFFAFW